jgi:hypothetical protein
VGGGTYNNGTTIQTLGEHWNGTAWKLQKSPNVGGSSTANQLHDVTATSSTNAWAVGGYEPGIYEQTLVEHWNGTAWKRVTSPDPAGSSQSHFLSGVTATSSTNAWAVGYYHNGGAPQTLVLHWNGTSWKQQKSPDPVASPLSNELSDVAATSSTNAWAVGLYDSICSSTETLVARWNGTSWKRQPSPNVIGSSVTNQLFGVAASSSTDAWAVGDFAAGTSDQPLAIHCC